jgi:hypothetical protein
MTNALTVGAREKESFDFGGLSVCWKVDGNQTGGRFSGCLLYTNPSPRDRG